MKLVRIAPPLALVVVLALAAAPAPASAQYAGQLGAGVYQSPALRVFQVYPTLGVWVAPTFMLQFGFDFSTIESQNYGFMTRAGYKLTERGDARIMMGVMFEVHELTANATQVVFGPFGGVDYAIGDDFSIILDAYPFGIAANGSTEAVFMEARIGAMWWFR